MGCDGQEQQEGGPVSVRSCPWRTREVALERRVVALEQGGDSQGVGQIPRLGGRKAPPTPNRFLQIKGPQLPFFPIMAPEAHLLNWKQKDCFTSHKWGRSWWGQKHLSGMARSPAAGGGRGRGTGGLNLGFAAGLSLENRVLTSSLQLRYPQAPGGLWCPGASTQVGTPRCTLCLEAYLAMTT